MAIPEAQLETWSHQGAITMSSDAYARISRALSHAGSPLQGRNVSISLQGSYANATNTYGDSDIDVVVVYEDAFYKDVSRLTLPEQQAHERSFVAATYNWYQLHSDVLSALRSYFGHSAVTVGNKAIKVNTGAGRMTADVVPAFEFRRYATFIDPQNLTAHWGIQFFDARSNMIVNYPKYHIERGQDKNQSARTGSRYKSVVRVFKNLRSNLIDRGLLGRDIAPSYFVECAIQRRPTRTSIQNFRKLCREYWISYGLCHIKIF